MNPLLPTSSGCRGRSPGARLGIGRLAVIALVVFAALPAMADQEAAPPRGDVDTDSDDGTTDKVAKKKKKVPEGLIIRGRVVGRAAYENVDSEGGDRESLDLSLPKARLDLRYRPNRWLTLVLKLDATKKTPVRNAFVQARSKHLLARAGQFKMPVSSLTMESSWVLPIARRGIIQDLLRSRMTLVSRRPGVLVSARGAGKLDPELSLSAFQGAAADDKGDLTLITGAVDAQNVVLRLAVTPSGQDLGIFGVRTSTVQGGILYHHYAAGADGLAEWTFGTQGLRLWAEALGGDARYAMGLTSYSAVYWTARAIVSWRWGGMEDGQHYVEPFVYLAAFDPDAKVGSDLVWEGFAGVNVGLWRQARLTLQLERAHAGRAVPFDLFFGGRALHDHTAVVLQAGAAY
jgi:hypothetical protein